MLLRLSAQLPSCETLLGFTESLLDLNKDELNACLVSMEPSIPFILCTFLKYCFM